MSGNNAKQKLIDYLDEHAFQPVLQVKPEDYPENKRDKLADVQRATASEVKRFRGYDSAEKVVDMYRDDLSSNRAKEIIASSVISDCRPSTRFATALKSWRASSASSVAAPASTPGFQGASRFGRRTEQGKR